MQALSNWKWWACRTTILKPFIDSQGRWFEFYRKTSCLLVFCPQLRKYQILPQQRYAAEYYLQDLLLGPPLPCLKCTLLKVLCRIVLEVHLLLDRELLICGYKNKNCFSISFFNLFMRKFWKVKFFNNLKESVRIKWFWIIDFRFNFTNDPWSVN